MIYTAGVVLLVVAGRNVVESATVVLGWAIASIVAAVLLSPLVEFLDRFLPRVLAILLVFLAVAAIGLAVRSAYVAELQGQVDYLAERRQHAEARRAAFVAPPSGPNQVWQLDFSEFETRHGGTWRIGGVADYWSKLELGWHVSTKQNQRDAIETARMPPMK